MRHLTTNLFRCAAAVLLLAPALVAAPGGVAQPDKRVSLQPTFTPGYEAKVVMEMTRTSTRLLSLGPAPDAKPQESSTSGHEVIDFLLHVVRSDEKASVVTLRVDRIEMSAKTMKGEFDWKSTDPREQGDNNNPVLSTMRPALGSTITFEFDPQGNVTKVDNGGVQLPTGELADFIRLAVGMPEVRARWSPIFSPRKGDFSVEIGQKWTGEEKINTPPLGAFTESRQYVLSSASDRLAVIDFTGSYALGPSAEGQAVMFKVKESAVTGSIHWDRTVGFFESMELDQRIELEGNAQGIPIGFRTETRFKIRREPAAPSKPQ